MTLDEYLSLHGLTNAAFAAEVGADQSTIARLRSTAQLPSRDLMRRIYVATNCAVSGDDFYGIGKETSE